MRLVLSAYGTRGDIEPSVAVGRELKKRGHDVLIALPPDLVGFAESEGLAAVPMGLDTNAWLDVYRELWTTLLHRFWRVREVRQLWREMWRLSDQAWTQMSTALAAVSEGADLLVAGQSYQEPAANVAEYRDIPFATLHNTPIRVNSQLLSSLPAAAARFVMRGYDWLGWRLNKKVEDTQRRGLGLPRADGPVSRRIAERGSLELQAYDPSWFPGLAEEWADWSECRPFVGTLTLEQETAVDGEVSQWIAAGRPPVFFGFGSMPIESPTETITMIAEACAELGERALVGAGRSDFSQAPAFDHVKVVGPINYAAVFPTCRAVVHHGGVGTLAAGLRAGMPTLVLWIDGAQPIWAARVTALGVGAVRSYAKTTRATLVVDLRKVLRPECAARARAVGAGMRTATESVALAADAVERFIEASVTLPPERPAGHFDKRGKACEQT